MNTEPIFTTEKSWRMISMKPERKVEDLDHEKGTDTRVINFYHNQTSHLQQHEQPGVAEVNPAPAPHLKPYLGIYSNFVERIIKLIEAHIDDEYYGIDQLCRDAGASRSQLHCKLKALTGLSTSIFIRTIRLHKAKALLLGTDLNITQVAFEVGFSDSRYFSRVFSQAFQQSPKDFREHSMGFQF